MASECFFSTNEFPVTDEDELDVILSGVWTGDDGEMNKHSRREGRERLFSLWGEGVIHTVDDDGRERDAVFFLRQLAGIVPLGRPVHLRWIRRDEEWDLSAGVHTLFNGNIVSSELAKLEETHESVLKAL